VESKQARRARYYPFNFVDATRQQLSGAITLEDLLPARLEQEYDRHGIHTVRESGSKCMGSSPMKRQSLIGSALLAFGGSSLAAENPRTVVIHAGQMNRETR
jgi:hypothetical protein